MWIPECANDNGTNPSLSYSTPYAAGDVITVHLDLNTHTLSFAKNDGALTISHSALPQTAERFYRLAASIGDSDDAVRILSHTIVGN